MIRIIFIQWKKFFLYLLEVNLILLILGFTYAFFLKKETFHQLNRLILGGIIVLAFLLPFIPAPSYTEVIVNEWQTHLPSFLIEKTATLTKAKPELPLYEIDASNAQDAGIFTAPSQNNTTATIGNGDKTTAPMAQPEALLIKIGLLLFFYWAFTAFLFLSS